MSKIVLYSLDPSPPCRAVLLLGEAIGINFNVRTLDLFEGEHLKADFVKINPQHTIPTLDDDGFILWDSHAILSYLVDKYATDDSLYPKDLQRRALIDQRLHFESGILFPALRGIVEPVLYYGDTDIPREKLEKVEKAYVFLNKFLEGKQWLAGDSYTIADISCVPTVSSMTVIKPIDNHPNLEAWLKRCEEEIPGYDKINKRGNQIFTEMFNSKFGKA